MAARDGDGAGDVLGLGERLKQMASRIDFKLRLYNEVVVEYKELKKVICDLANEKERLDQERHKSKEELKAANGDLAAATENLAAVQDQLTRSKQKLNTKNKELNTKNKELNAKGEELNALRVKLQKEIKDSGGPPLGDLAVREIRKLDEKPFKDVYTELLPEKEAKEKARILYSKWEKLVNDPSSWNRFFKINAVVANGDIQDYVIDVNNDELKELKTTGEEAYNSVIDTLNERKEYNIDGKFDFLLWNSKEKRKATLEECVDYLIALGKKHTFDDKKGPNRK
ncbi:hypothetical protein BS78_08G098800 [Paspalum vaginatum]|nr:hypothetical protein BS78_08G098800 [Paspalum vaginatum]